MTTIKKSKVTPKITVSKTDLLIGNKKTVRGYHTLEYRKETLEYPIFDLKDISNFILYLENQKPI